MITRTKYTRTLSVIHTNGTTDEVSDSVLATSAFDQFLHKEETNVTENKVVAFHAIEYVQTSVTQTQEEVDNDCDLACSVMPNPTLTAPTETIEVDAGEEFDPMVGVSAVDGNGDEVCRCVYQQVWDFEEETADVLTIGNELITIDKRGKEKG